MILSEFLIVENRWAITIEVLFFINFSKASWTNFSDSESSDDVASSRISIGEFDITALEMAILCFCPPERLDPLSPTLYLYFSSYSLINSYAFAIFEASINLCWSWLPKRIFSSIDALKRMDSWVTILIRFLNFFRYRNCTTRISFFCCSYS